jgi:5-methylcytosine-specific restriction enzyme subunit McrC
MNTIIRLREHESADPRTHPGLRRSLSDADAATADALTASGKLAIVERRDGICIKADRYVGVVSIGDLTVQIRPKLGPEYLPSFLRYALGVKRHDTVRDAGVPLAKLGFIDLIAMLFLDEFDAIAQSGIFQEYRTRDATFSSPKGRIQFSRLARIPAGGSLTVPCRFDEHTHDIPLNRLLLATLTSLRSAVSDYALAFDLHARSAMLSELCTPAILDIGLVDACRLALNRMSQYYESAVDLAALILESMGVSALGERDQTMPGFLFDMALLFERFVSRLCQDYAPPGIVIQSQAATTKAFAYIANPYNWLIPRLQPDIVVRDVSGKPVRILDTKYKLIAPNNPPTPADLYQLTLYSLGFDRHSAVPARIVYPVLTHHTAEPVLMFRGFDGTFTGAQVSCFGLDMAACSAALNRRDTNALQAIVKRLLQ